MNTIPASVYIITLNEEAHLRRALESVKHFAEIIVIDSGSTDATCDIAREYTEHVQHQDWLGFSKQKQYALSLCNQDWVLNLDADEEVSIELSQEISYCISNSIADGLNIPFDDRFLFQPNHPWRRKNAKPRFFRRDKGRYGDDAVHEAIHIDGKIGNAKGCINHYGESSTAIKLLKNNHYSDLRSKEYFARGKRPSVIKLLFAFPFAFFRSYILKRSFLNGWSGFICSMVNAFYAFLKEAKLYELQLKKKQGIDQD